MSSAYIPLIFKGLSEMFSQSHFFLNYLVHKTVGYDCLEYSLRLKFFFFLL